MVRSKSTDSSGTLYGTDDDTGIINSTRFDTIIADPPAGTATGVSNFFFDDFWNDINGTKGDDILHGTDERDHIYGSDGNDSLFGHGSLDWLFGGNGADHLDGGAGYDFAWYTDSGAGVWVNLATGFGRHGTAQGDTLVSIEGIHCSRYDDVITGADVTDQGNNFYEGWLGDDTFIGGLVAEFMWGGAGYDTANYVNSNVGVTAILGNGEEDGHGHGGTAEGDVYLEIEGLNGSFFADTLIGNDGDNFLNGSMGDDMLKGGGGADILYGGLGSNSGDDTLKGGGGADVLEGGAGIDTAAYNESEAGVFVSLMSNTGDSGDAEGDTLYNIERLTGSAHEDTLWGNDGANVLNGMLGNDSLKGFGGADFLTGGIGNDILYGMDDDDTLRGDEGTDTLFGGAGIDSYLVEQSGDAVVEFVGEGTFDRVRTIVSYALAAGSEVEALETPDQFGTAAIDLVGNEFNNTIVGNAGTNVIVGGAGLDTMVGGGGADIFVWNSIGEMGSTVGANSDTVGSEFNALIGDKIALNPIDADGNATNGDTAFTFFGDASNPFTAAGQVSWFNNGPGTDTYILLNTNGDANAEGVIRVLGVHTVDASWFVV
jgi:Ca2+-binding RTX toxin-like protein